MSRPGACSRPWPSLDGGQLHHRGDVAEIDAAQIALYAAPWPVRDQAAGGGQRQTPRASARMSTGSPASEQAAWRPVGRFRLPSRPPRPAPNRRYWPGSRRWPGSIRAPVAATGRGGCGCARIRGLALVESSRQGMPRSRRNASTSARSTSSSGRTMPVGRDRPDAGQTRRFRRRAGSGTARFRPGRSGYGPERRGSRRRWRWSARRRPGGLRARPLPGWDGRGQGRPRGAVGQGPGGLVLRTHESRIARSAAGSGGRPGRGRTARRRRIPRRAGCDSDAARSGCRSQRGG